MPSHERQAKTKHPDEIAGCFFVTKDIFTGYGAQPTRVNLYFHRREPKIGHSYLATAEFLRELKLLIHADDGGVWGAAVSNQTIGDLAFLDIAVRVGPRVTLLDRVEINMMELSA